ncbi:CYTH and CHAD domain-containing protein [Thermopolyspora sp. NPDC052614]|uniref:CYTH and CHAD domain-containing protein n=1 Tax=Thermopolyspora sp. NPDC052614 TaxID=3155682 RepID=UPI0034460E03
MEIEDKFDVPTEFVVPDLSDLPGCAEVVGPKSHQLVAIYFDTPDFRLATRGITLRRRRGGLDPGWHLKLPKAKGVRREITHPLTRSIKIVPTELADLVRAYTRGAELVPIAQLDTKRNLTRLLDDNGDLLLEIADDRVKGTVLGDDPVVDRWREVEAELVKGDAALLKKAGKRLRKAGATPADASSKLARLLDTRLRAIQVSKPVEGTAGAVVVGYLASQVNALLAQDARVRQAEDDAVHQMRVASRRLRSALKSFKTIIADTTHIQDELKWLGQALSEARDLEVIRARFAAHFDRLPEDLIVGRVRTRLGSDLEDREHVAYDHIRETLSGDRYYALLDALDTLIAHPPLTPLAAKKPDKPLRAVADKGWRRIGRTYDAAQALDDIEARELAMHDVRKVAKRARYTAEVLIPVFGSEMTDMANRAEAIQEILGLYQDSVAAQSLLVEAAETARQAGEDTFTYGVLVGLERAAAERDHAEFPRVWRESI